MSLDGVLVEWLRWVVLALTDSLDRPGGMVFHEGPFGRLPHGRVDPAPRAPGERHGDHNDDGGKDPPS